MVSKQIQYQIVGNVISLFLLAVAELLIYQTNYWTALAALIASVIFFIVPLVLAKPEPGKQRDWRPAFLYAIVAVLLVTVFLRTGLLQFQGMFEPDGFFYFTALKQAIANNFVVHATVNLSGYPFHNGLNEAPGAIYTVLIPYAFLQYFGVGPLTVMRLIAILFGIFDAIGAYFLAKYITKSRLLGVFSMFFVAASSGNIARTAGTVFRGDTFITIFVILALVFMLKIMSEPNKRKLMAYTLIAAIVVGSGQLIWDGGILDMAVYFGAAMLLLVYVFVRGNRDSARRVLLVYAALIAGYVLNYVYTIAGVLGLDHSNLLAGASGLAILLVPTIGAIAAYYIFDRMEKHHAKHGHYGVYGVIAGTRARRIATLCVAAIVALAAAYLVAGQAVTELATVGGQIFVYNSGFVGGTTQELQAPSLPFLFASNGVELFLAPIGVFFGFMLLADKLIGRRYKMNTLTTYLAGITGMVIGMLVAYFGYGALGPTFGTISLMFLPGAIGLALAFCVALIADQAMVRDNFITFFGELKQLPAYGIIAVTVYLAMTTYMQAGAIRYNSIISVPIAIFSAFAIYVFVRWAGDYVLNISGAKLPIVAIVIGVIVGLVALQITLTTAQSFTSFQADGINPLFLSAMTWISQNTPANSTFLALWPDGSVIEGWGNRTSFMDSVGGENGTRILYFSKFLFNDTTDQNYITGNVLTSPDAAGKPNYIVVRNFFIDELGGIAEEGNLTGNLSAYGYDQLTNLQSGGNASAQVYQFSNSQYTTRLVLQQSNGIITNVTGYFGIVNTNQYQLMSHVLLMNSGTYQYQLYNATMPALNYSLLVEYENQSITGAALVGSGLLNTNMFRLLYMCTFDECAYGNSNITARLVYGNPDTKIISLTYA